MAIKRARIDWRANYFAIQDEALGTYRYRIDDSLEIGWQEYPEVVDISLGTLCRGGCSYCYASATSSGVLYERVVEKINRWLGDMSLNRRPFQVAFGGGGEPTMHPEFIGALYACSSWGTVPNYTTNGLGLTAAILDATRAVCGGVAVTAHSHLPWRKGVTRLLGAGVRTNLHVIVGQQGSAERALRLRREFPEVESVVLLPLVATGFASSCAPVEEEVMGAVRIANQVPGFAIGAMYKPYIARYPAEFKKFSLYDEALYSGYLVLGDPPQMFVSSFDLVTRSPAPRNEGQRRRL